MCQRRQLTVTKKPRFKKMDVKNRTGMEVGARHAHRGCAAIRSFYTPFFQLEPDYRSRGDLQNLKSNIHFTIK